MIVFCWRIKMSFWSRPSSRDFKLIRMDQQNNHLSHEIHYILRVEVSLFVPSPEIKSRNVVEADNWARHKKAIYSE
jgi:hypothetical protein